MCVNIEFQCFGFFFNLFLLDLILDIFEVVLFVFDLGVVFDVISFVILEWEVVFGVIGYVIDFDFYVFFNGFMINFRSYIIFINSLMFNNL